MDKPNVVGPGSIVYSDLSGTWYAYDPRTGNKGSVCTMEQQGSMLTFVNEYGMRSSGSFVDGTTVVASDWEGGLRGTLRDGNQIIAFGNGAFWERMKRGSTGEVNIQYPDLSGTWYGYDPRTGNKGNPQSISQNSENLPFIDEYTTGHQAGFLIYKRLF